MNLIICWQWSFQVESFLTFHVFHRQLIDIYSSCLLTILHVLKTVIPCSFNHLLRHPSIHLPWYTRTPWLYGRHIFVQTRLVYYLASFFTSCWSFRLYYFLFLYSCCPCLFCSHCFRCFFFISRPNEYFIFVSLRLTCSPTDSSVYNDFTVYDLVRWMGQEIRSCAR